MTVDEIKERYSMREIVERYGIRPNRNGFASCPFHKGDNTASMKVYKDSFYCYGCGASGDIFTFIQRMENCSFKEAFYSLGGTYEHDRFSANLARYKSQKKREMQEKQAQKLKEKKALNNMLIDIYRCYTVTSEPFSEVWCDCMNKLIYQLYLHEVLNEKR